MMNADESMRGVETGAIGGVDNRPAQGKNDVISGLVWAIVRFVVFLPIFLALGVINAVSFGRVFDAPISIYYLIAGWAGIIGFAVGGVLCLVRKIWWIGVGLVFVMTGVLLFCSLFGAEPGVVSDDYLCFDSGVCKKEFINKEKCMEYEAYWNETEETCYLKWSPVHPDNVKKRKENEKK